MIRRGVIWILVPRRIRLRAEDLAFSWAMTSESYGGSESLGARADYPNVACMAAKGK